MKKQILVLAVSIVSMMMVSGTSFAATENPIQLNTPGLDFLIGQGGNPDLVPVEEDPGVDAEVIEEVVHNKEVLLNDFKVQLKWTSLGYGQMTEKVIVPELAAHTVFNHRNPGEEGPCLRSFRRFGQTELNHEGDLLINVKILNRYEINREKKICRVSMVEDVRTRIDGVEFSHTYNKPMGFRYIADCPAAQ